MPIIHKPLNIGPLPDWGGELEYLMFKAHLEGNQKEFERLQRQSWLDLNKFA